MMRRMNLMRIDEALAAVAAGPASGLPEIADVQRRMSLGYAYVDSLLAEGVNAFGYGASHHLLELNHRVLCGVSPERRAQFSGHIAETERRFYAAGPSGYEEIFSWMERARGREPRSLAAGVFVHIVSTPQLFIEGNRRTATLIASLVLVRGTQPPFVLTPSTYADYTSLADRCASVLRSGIAGLAGVKLKTMRLERFFANALEPDFLAPPARPDAPVRDADSALWVQD